MPSSIASSSHTTASSSIPSATRTAAELRHLTLYPANAVNAHPMSAAALLPAPAFTKISHRPVRPKSSKLLFKSQSTPHLRGRHMMSESELAKRNKLGYQRISIACAHCRRRKIRCLIAEDAPDGRCANCIRLKKECVFYPVEQQAAIDAQHNDHSNRTNNPSGPSLSVSNSPPQAASRTLVQHDQSRGSPYPSSSAADDHTAFGRGIPIAPSQPQPPPGSMSAPIPQPGQFEHTNGYFGPTHYGYPPHGDTNALDHQAPNFSRPMPVASPHIAQSAYGGAPPRADTAPYPVSSPSDVSQYTYSPMAPHEYSPYQAQHQQWAPPPQPVRSMSYSGPATGYPPQQPSGMYPPPFQYPAQSAHHANYPPPQYDPRLGQYSNHHAPPPSGHHPYMAPMSTAPPPVPLASQPHYPQHYQPTQPLQPLQSNWFGGPVDDAGGRSHNVRTSRPG